MSKPEDIQEPIENKSEENSSLTAQQPETDSPAAEPSTPLSEEEKLVAENAELKDKYLRLYSEFDNFRKRTAKEKIELIQTASEGLVVELISVLDDMQRAQANAAEGEISEGVMLIFAKLQNTLQAKGLKEMDAQGQTFDVDLHDCITQFAAPTDELKGKVIDVIEKGYYLKDKVIRFAKVVVGN
jgi:molecular chaperone GrpE